MTTISSWVLSIAGVCVLSVLIDLFLPEGKMNSHIKTVFNFVIILVIIMPLPKLFKSSFDGSSIFTSEDIILQEDYIYQLNRDKLTMIENNIEKKLTDEGFLNIEISVYADIFTTQMIVETVFVDLSNLVIENNGQHIHIEKEVVEVIKSFIEIKEEDVVFDGN